MPLLEYDVKGILISLYSLYIIPSIISAESSLLFIPSFTVTLTKFSETTFTLAVIIKF